MTVHKLQRSGTISLLSADGNTLLRDKDAIFRSWAENYDSVPSSINKNAITKNAMHIFLNFQLCMKQ